MRGFQNGLIYLFIIAVLEIFAFKVQKRGDFFFGRFPPYEMPESGDKISNF